MAVLGVRLGCQPVGVTVAPIVVGALALLFVVSGVLPGWLQARARSQRVADFERHYKAHEAGDSSEKPWLVARRFEMQRDARSVGRGTMVVGPPPAVGGAVTQHQYFAELFDEAPFMWMVQGDDFLANELASINHELTTRERDAKRRLVNPWAWLRGAFENAAGLPRYVLRQAGFMKAANSTGARIVTVVWSALVGLAGIGSFVLALLRA